MKNVEKTGEARKRRLWPTWLPLLLLVAAGALLFAPLVDCPRCTTWDFFGPFETWDVRNLNPCGVCGGRRKVSLVRRWGSRPPGATPGPGS